MVAECLGTLLTMHPSAMMGELLGRCADPKDSLTRWTVASALKYAMTGNAPRQELEANLGTVLTLLSDEDLGVRQAGLQLCNAAVHHQPSLIAPHLSVVVLPAIFEAMLLKMPRVVDLGPFKQTIDDALPLRKAALATANTILEDLPEVLALNS